MFRPEISSQPRPLMQPKGKAGAFRVQVLTLFPGLFPGVLGESLIGKALKEGLWEIEAFDIRRFATDRHRTVDDSPAGGGAGMVMRADMLAKALDFAAKKGVEDRSRWPVVYLSPRGSRFDQKMAERFAEGDGLTLLCGRYEGVDQRVLDARDVEEISLGDFVLTGGEVAAQAVLDTVIRLRPGVLGNAASTEEESFSRGLLEHPQYTKPQVWEGRAIPEILLSGHHAKIAEWRLSQAERLTKERRPDLWRAYLDEKATEGDREQSGGQTEADTGSEKD
ncbi:MAG: tRNA (guanosine(37)-N1)-methyltransferase TrmD [Pseudomonadota bacterium]